VKNGFIFLRELRVIKYIIHVADHERFNSCDRTIELRAAKRVIHYYTQ